VVILFCLLVLSVYLCEFGFVDGQELVCLCEFILQICIFDFLHAYLQFYSLNLLPQSFLCLLELIKLKIKLCPDESISYFSLF